MTRQHARALPWLLLWVLALLVATGCTGRGSSASALHSVSSCAPGRVPGYSNHRSYPPGIPTLPPPGLRIVRCFSAEAQASRHGFPPAVPRGTLIVDGVFLLPTGRLTVTQCRAAARTLGFAVPCPAVAPALQASPLAEPNCQDDGGCVWGHDFIFMEEGFAVPPGYRGVFGMPDGHFVLLAGRSAASIDFCPLEPAIRTVVIAGEKAVLTTCPPGDAVISGHVFLRWVNRGIHALVSLHGVNATNIAVDIAIARHLVWISPPCCTRLAAWANAGSL